MSMNKDLVSYYKDRALEYEKIYLKPERQDDLLSATKYLQETFANKNVFEIACGTGYWTEKIAHTAKSIIATDINEAVIELAKLKSYPKHNVTFNLEDIYSFSTSTKYESLFGGFILSHIKLQDLDEFFNIVKNKVVPGGSLVFMDNHFVEGSNLPITRIDEDGNTFQTRTLKDGTSHLVIKNFLTEKILLSKLKDIASSFEFIQLNYFWVLTIKV